VVWFGEPIPVRAMETAREAVEACNLFFTIGTSGTVQPAASFARWAHGRGATVVVINLETSPFASEGWNLLQGPSGRILPELLEMAWPGKRGASRSAER